MPDTETTQLTAAQRRAAEKAAKEQADAEAAAASSQSGVTENTQEAAPAPALDKRDPARVLTKDYLIQNARSLLGSRVALVAGALSRTDKEELSLAEAQALLDEHLTTPVTTER